MTEARGNGLQIALDLFEAGERIMQQNLRRRHPDASERELESMLVAWLRDRACAPRGDCPGESWRAAPPEPA